MPALMIPYMTQYMYVCTGTSVGHRLERAANMIIINPRRACAARVTVVVLCVCVSVCVCVCVSTTILALQATRRLMSDTSSFSATRVGKITWRFC